MKKGVIALTAVAMLFTSPARVGGVSKPWKSPEKRTEKGMPGSTWWQFYKYHVITVKPPAFSGNFSGDFSGDFSLDLPCFSCSISCWSCFC